MSELIQPEELYDRLRIAAFRNRETVTDILRRAGLYASVGTRLQQGRNLNTRNYHALVAQLEIEEKQKPAARKKGQQKRGVKMPEWTK